MTPGNSIAGSGGALRRTLRQWQPDLRLGLDNLLLHKLRSLLTMLGMIFGVAAVVSMLSIGAGAQQHGHPSPAAGPPAAAGGSGQRVRAPGQIAAEHLPRPPPASR